MSRYDTDEPLMAQDEPCTVCGKPIEVMAYRMTGVCGDLHDKVKKGKLTREEADAIATGTYAGSV